MMDVFICMFNRRPMLQERTLYSWKKLRRENKDIQIRFIIHTQMFKEARELLDAAQLEHLAIFFDGQPSEFQRQRRIAAENLAESPIYVCADDDVVPSVGCVERALEIMAKPENASFGLLSLMPSNCNIVPWTPDTDYIPLVTPDCAEHVNVGLVRFTRKGIMPPDAEDWWPQEPNNVGSGWKYDQWHADQIRGRGYRVGHFRNLSCVHLGERSYLC